MTETVSNISKKGIIESRRGKDKIGKGKRAQSSASKRAGIKPRKKDEQSTSETISNLSQKVIIETRKGKEDKQKGKYDKYGKEQKYFSKNIVIVPAQTSYKPEKGQKFFSKNIIITPAKSTPNIYEVNKPGKDQKYFTKNIIIEPSRKTFEKSEKGKRTASSSFRNINIETRKGRDYNVAQEAHLRTASTDNKKAGKVMELLKGVQYFTKNIVITPVPIEYKTSTKKYGKEKDWKENSDKFANNNIIISSGKQTKSGSSGKRNQWEIDAKCGMDSFGGKMLNGRGRLGDNILQALDGYDDNTKFFHKEITILPVYIPPPKYSKQ